MVYIPKHERKILGEQIHETLFDKKKKLNDKEKELHRIDSSLSKIKEEVEREKVESEYLVPEVKNWIETKPIKELKDKIKKWLSLKHPIHIIGPTGCGKTTLALQIAKETGRPIVWINGDENITTTDLIGGYSQVEVDSIRDKYIHNVFKDKDVLKAEWVDNPLTLACKYGYTLIYNEFSRSKAIANNVLLSIFSEGILELPTKFGEGRYVKVHPDFRVIFTSNSIEYAGVHRAQDALLDRMVGIYMNYYDKETEAKIIASQSKISENNALIIASMLNSLRKKLPEEIRIGTRAGVMVAQALNLTKNFGNSAIKQRLLEVVTSKTKDLKQLEDLTKVIKNLWVS